MAGMPKNDEYFRVFQQFPINSCHTPYRHGNPAAAENRQVLRRKSTAFAAGKATRRAGFGRKFRPKGKFFHFDMVFSEKL